MTTRSEQKIKEQPKKALPWTGIPLRSIPASELGRCFLSIGNLQSLLLPDNPSLGERIKSGPLPFLSL